ncbi:hypothetical protein J6590_070354 [Homalodisca vitripennis]|nr:hypothetical protein J6590_070354 [Homalodisca vitripennis]
MWSESSVEVGDKFLSPTSTLLKKQGRESGCHSGSGGASVNEPVDSVFNRAIRLLGFVNRSTKFITTSELSSLYTAPALGKCWSFRRLCGHPFKLATSGLFNKFKTSFCELWE